MFITRDYIDLTYSSVGVGTDYAFEGSGFGSKYFPHFSPGGIRRFTCIIYTHYTLHHLPSSDDCYVTDY